ALIEQPSIRVEGVIARGRIAVLGREPVIEGEHPHAGSGSEPRNKARMRSHAADLEAAAVAVQGAVRALPDPGAVKPGPYRRRPGLGHGGPGGADLGEIIVEAATDGLQGRGRLPGRRHLVKARPNRSQGVAAHQGSGRCSTRTALDS